MWAVFPFVILSSNSAALLCTHVLRSNFNDSVTSQLRGAWPRINYEFIWLYEIALTKVLFIINALLLLLLLLLLLSHMLHKNIFPILRCWVTLGETTYLAILSCRVPLSTTNYLAIIWCRVSPRKTTYLAISCMLVTFNFDWVNEIQSSNITPCISSNKFLSMAWDVENKIKFTSSMNLFMILYN